MLFLSCLPGDHLAPASARALQLDVVANILRLASQTSEQVGRGAGARPRQLRLGGFVTFSLRILVSAAPRGREQQLVHLVFCRSTCIIIPSESHSWGSFEVGLPADVIPPS